MVSLPWLIWLSIMATVAAIAAVVACVVVWENGRELRAISWWNAEATLPQVDGFNDFDMLMILRRAADLEYPKKTGGKHLKGRRQAFSRRAMEDFVKRDRFETLRDDLVRQGYLTSSGTKKSNRWTGRGRVLLMQVKAGRFGPVELYNVQVGNEPPFIPSAISHGKEKIRSVVK